MRSRPDIKNLFEGIKNGSVAALSRAITLLESSKPEDRIEAQNLMGLLYPNSGNAFRIGITGPPGVGKSSFIEAFGNFLADFGKKIAVLTIDPSSPLAGGSILGDKTRMEDLGRRDGVYIRPSPSGNTLGGIAIATREAMYACEAAGFEWILIESAGVGQTDYVLAELVDVLVLLSLPGAGDELQGIKRGIMEMADLIIITKADGENLDKAYKAQIEHQSALHLFPPRFTHWTVPVLLTSAFSKAGLKEVSDSLFAFKQASTKAGVWLQRRNHQYQSWQKSLAVEALNEEFKRFIEAHTKGQKQERPPYLEAEKLIRDFKSTL